MTKEKVFEWMFAHENEYVPLDDIVAAVLFGVIAAFAFAAGNAFGGLGAFLVVALGYIAYQKFMVWFMCDYYDYANRKDEESKKAE